MLLSDKIAVAPMVRLAVPLVIGIVLSDSALAPLWALGIAALLCYALGWIMFRSPVGGAYIFGAVLISGIFLTRLHRTDNVLPAGERIIMSGEVVEIPVESGRWSRAKVRITAFLPESDSVWRKADEALVLRADTSYHLGVGEQIGFRGYFNLTDSTNMRFTALMKARGVTGYSYLTRGNLVSRSPFVHKSAVYYAAKAQGWAVERLMRLGGSDESRAMAAALVAGDRRFLSREVRDDYSTVGASHILAVSGLHMNFVFVIVNLLLALVTLTPRGHIVKNGAVVAAIWAYTVMAGLAPSAVRAALMLSAVQLSLGISSPRNSYNILFGAGVVMLFINPYYLFDVGFQLSFMAVLSILFFLPRFVRWLPLRGNFARKAASALLIGFAAQVGIIPILAYNFGSIPFLGVLLSSIISLTAFLIITVGLVWVVAPVSFMAGATGWLVELFTTIQNGVISLTATSPLAAVKVPGVGGTGVIITYLLIFALCLTIEMWEDSRHQKLSTRP